MEASAIRSSDARDDPIRKRYDREFREGAVWIVEETRKPIAFDRLRDLSMQSNVKLRDVAEQLIYTGDSQQRRD